MSGRDNAVTGIILGCAITASVVSLGLLFLLEKQFDSKKKPSFRHEISIYTNEHIYNIQPNDFSAQQKNDFDIREDDNCILFKYRKSDKNVK
jgi:hypothetical protein